MILVASGSAQVWGYNFTGESFSILNDFTQALVMDRDGQTVAECPKGWQYIADMTNTNVRNLIAALILITTGSHINDQ